MDEFDRLGAGLDGDLLTPASPGYEAARRPAMARYHEVRPRAVVQCASTNDVVNTIAYARNSDTHVAARGGGHCFAGRSSTEGLVLDLSRLNAVAVDDDGRATIGAGARLAHVYDALHDRARTLPAGCGPTVGIAGLTLGGGLGLLGRARGLTCDALLGAQVVLADGRVVRCDAEREPELFWALRGAGGGQFGVATSLVFSTVPEPRATRFELVWPDAAAAGVIGTWQDWAPDAPDDITANLTVIAEPGHPLHVAVFGAALRNAEPTTAMLNELVARAGGRPHARLREGMVLRDLKRSFAVDYATAPATTTSRSEFFAHPLPAPAIDALLDGLTAAGAGGRRELNFTAMGGATTGWPRTLRRSSTAASGSCSNTPLTTARSGSTGRGRSRTRTAPRGSTRTSPTRSSTTGPRPTTAATSRALPRLNTPMTPTGSSTSRRHSDPNWRNACLGSCCTWGMPLDGYVASDREHPGVAVPEDDELVSWKLERITNAGAHLMGRTTYQEMAGHWPHPWTASPDPPRRDDRPADHQRRPMSG